MAEPRDPRIASGFRGAANPHPAEVIALKPFGGHKGMCLALFVEVVISVLAGDLLGYELIHQFDPQWDTPCRSSRLVVGFDLKAFGPAAEVPGRLSRLLSLLRIQAPASSTERPYPRHLRRPGRLRDG